MAINDNNITPSSPSLSSMKKAFGVTNIKAHVPLVLDLDQLNYDAWSELFTTYCYSFGVLGFLDGTIVHINNDANDWKKVDSLVKVWIYGTISTSLLQTVLKKTVTAKDMWMSLKNIFHDNKDARALELHEELRSLDLGNLTIAEYFKKIKVTADLLSNIDAAVDEKTLVMYAINGHATAAMEWSWELWWLNGPYPATPTASLSGPRPGAPGYWVYGPDQATTLPHAFNTMSFRYADNNKDSGWYMDTGATSHLSADPVIVINGSSILVTHSGHVQIPNPYRPLYLRNVFVTPNIIKNLVSVRKFTTDKCSIDFDPYGFSVRDYHTRQTLLRCDNTGDLYPLHVAASAFALLTNNHSFWHQRLGHPGDVVIQTLSSRGLVSYKSTFRIKYFDPYQCLGCTKSLSG
ncbi:hypothetical protein Tco_0163432 [Tanacetum coccineum]